MRKRIFSKSNKAEIEQTDKLTRNEKLTLTLSSAALIVSLGQLLLTSQFFTDLFVKPDIYASAKNYNLEKDKVITTFKITNRGNKTAENLIINLSCFKKDTCVILPIATLDTTVRENGEPLKDITIKTEKFVPGDYIFIQIYSDTSTFNSVKKQLIDQKISPNAFTIPFLNFVKFKDGFVNIDRYPEK